MAEIKTFPLFRHLRAEPTSHVLGYKSGALRREGPERAAEHAAAAMVEAQGADEREALAAARQATTIDEVQGAQLRIDERRAQIDAATGADILLALVVRELAGQLGQIEHLTVTPDMLAPVLARLNGAER
jgi:hypothetical protein